MGMGLGTGLAMAKMVSEGLSGQPQATPAASAAQASDPMAILKQLKGMLDAGLILQSEYDAKKADVLSRM